MAVRSRAAAELTRRCFGAPRAYQARVLPFFSPHARGAARRRRAAASSTARGRRRRGHGQRRVSKGHARTRCVLVSHRSLVIMPLQIGREPRPRPRCKTSRRLHAVLEQPCCYGGSQRCSRASRRSCLGPRGQCRSHEAAPRGQGEHCRSHEAARATTAATTPRLPDPKCTQRGVDKAYRRAAVCHREGGDPEEFKKLNEAREVLSDPAKKAVRSFGKAGVDGTGRHAAGQPRWISQGGNNAQAQQMFEQMLCREARRRWRHGRLGGPSRGASPSPSLDDCFTACCPWRSRIMSGAASAAPGAGEATCQQGRATPSSSSSCARRPTLCTKTGVDLLG